MSLIWIAFAGGIIEGLGVAFIFCFLFRKKVSKWLDF